MFSEFSGCHDAKGVGIAAHIKLTIAEHIRRAGRFLRAGHESHVEGPRRAAYLVNGIAVRIAGGQGEDFAAIHVCRSAAIVDGDTLDALAAAERVLRVIFELNVEMHVSGEAQEPATALTVGVGVEHVTKNVFPVVDESPTTEIGQGQCGAHRVVRIEITDGDFTAESVVGTQNGHVEAESVGRGKRVTVIEVGDR